MHKKTSTTTIVVITIAIVTRLHQALLPIASAMPADPVVTPMNSMRDESTEMGSVGRGRQVYAGNDRIPKNLRGA